VVTTMIVVALTWKLIFNEDYGLLNGVLQGAHVIDEPIHWLTSPGLVLYSIMAVTTWKGLGYYMVIFLAGLRAIPPEIHEAARIDGARGWQILWHIKIPALRPTLQLVMIISAIAAIQVFEEIYVMTEGKPDHASSTIVHMLYETSFDINQGRLDFGYASAMGVLLFGLLVVFTSLSLWVTRRSEERA
jgi:putative chitobiose transport system permease protein